MRSLSLRPDDSLPTPRVELPMGFGVLVSRHPAIHATRLLTLASVGLPTPTERASLFCGVAPVRWTVNCFRDRHCTLSKRGTEIAPPVSIVDPEGTVRSLVPRDRS